ncbi:MAG: polyprenyl synthetase family protein [Rhodothermales bacterium]
MSDASSAIVSDSGLAPVSPRSDERVTLHDIRRPVEKELEHFRTYFRRSMWSRVRLLDKITQYVLRQKGKQIRPILVLLSARMCGDISESSYRAAALVELMHSATLVHDDVVDDADMRRGVFSINALWKNKIAVLFGDFLLSRGLLLALEYQDYAVLHALSDAVKRMSEGEFLQIEKSRHLDIDEETYFRIISDKTASLIAACTACGALSTTDDRDVIERMRLMGEKLGLAFQIRDDLFDYGVDDIGKPVGIDLQEKKLTLPLIHSLREASSSDRRSIMRIVRKKKKSKDDVRVVSHFVTDSGGIAYARERMDELAAEARRLILTFDETSARDAMLSLVTYTVQRSK